MDQDLNIKRAHNTELGFNTTRMTFVFGNIGAIAINSFADLTSQSQVTNPIGLSSTKAKLIKKVTSIKPKCPKGYKRSNLPTCCHWS